MHGMYNNINCFYLTYGLRYPDTLEAIKGSISKVKESKQWTIDLDQYLKI